MRVLLTGGTGLIGREIGKRLVARGDSVVSLVRDLKRAQLHEPFPATRYQWSMTGPVPAEALKGVDAVIHLAGEPIAEGRWTEERKRSIRNSRVQTTQALVEAIERNGGVSAFIQASAIGYYGDRGAQTLDADSERGTGFLPDVVADWEQPAQTLENKNVRVVWIRTAAVLSRQGGALEKLLPVFRSGLGARLGFAGDQWMSWIHIDDIVGLFLHSLDSKKVSGVLEGSAPEPVTNRTFTSELASQLGVVENMPVPQAMIKLMYGEMASVVLSSARVLPKRTLETGYRFLYPDLQSALSNLVSELKGQTREMFAEQWLPQKPETIWPYFCDEKNLEELTPSLLHFKVLKKSDPEIKEGTLIDYTMRLNGLPFGWRTKIEAWEPAKKFVDTQLKGPYSLWHHTHEFIPLGSGTLMRDRVLYRLPLGWLGSVAAGWKVVSDVQTIFKYRRLKIDERFGS